MRVLEIDLLSLPPGRSVLETEASPAELELAEPQYRFAEPVRVLLDVDKGELEIVLRGTVVAVATVECSRCLAAFEDAVTVPCSLIVHRVNADSPMLREAVDEEGIRFVPRSATSVDLRDEVRSALILALPIKPICREECRGLCPECGNDLNLGDCGCVRAGGDPRWSALDTFRRQEESPGR